MRYADIVNEDELTLEEGSEASLVPAIKHIPTGKIYAGDIGSHHAKVAQDNGLFRVGWQDNPDIKTGFLNHRGQFLTRSRALDYALTHDLVHNNARKYLAGDDVPAELGASFLKK